MTMAGFGLDEIENYNLDCAVKQLRTILIVSYYDSSEVVGHHESGGWEGLIPDSLSEIYVNGICRSK